MLLTKIVTSRLSFFSCSSFPLQLLACFLYCLLEEDSKYCPDCAQILIKLLVSLFIFAVLWFVCMSLQRHRKGEDFLNGTVLFTWFFLPPYAFLCSPWWSLHRLPLWINNKCAESYNAMRANIILNLFILYPAVVLYPRAPSSGCCVSISGSAAVELNSAWRGRLLWRTESL